MNSKQFKVYLSGMLDERTLGIWCMKDPQTEWELLFNIHRPKELASSFSIKIMPWFALTIYSVMF